MVSNKIRNKNDWKTHFAISLGSNVEPGRHLPLALEGLARLGELVAVSGVYRTAPLGRTDQPDFHNLALWLRTELHALALLRRCLELEQGMGRVREERWGPRTIDIDLILRQPFARIEHPGLILPHPRWRERAFVVAPLAEMGRGPAGLEGLLQATGGQRIERLGGLDATLIPRPPASRAPSRPGPGS